MNRIYAAAVRRPKATILAAALLTLAAASGMVKLELRTDGRALVPQQAPEVRFDHEIRETFDVEDQIAVVVESDDPAGIFNLDTLHLVAELTRELAALDGVEAQEVTSLATERSRWNRGRALEFNTFLEPFPETAADLDRIRRDLAGMEIYTGTLISRDGGEPEDWRPSAAAILIGVEDDVDRPRLHRRINDLVAARDQIRHRIHVVGAPIAESLLGTHILEDLATLVPIAVVVMSLIFFLRYRSTVSVLLPMSEVGAALVFVFGVMGHLGVPVSLTITVLPVILTAIGVADEIHVFDRYAQIRARRTDGEDEDQDRVAAVLRTMDEMWRPVVKTSITTSIGFLSFTLSPIAPVRHFGLFTAAGILFCMFWTLTVIAAGLRLSRSASFSRVPAGSWPQRFAALGDGVRRRRRAVAAAAAVVALAVPFGLWRVTVQDSWIDGFAERSPFRQSTETVNRLFHGTHILLVSFDARPAGMQGELRPIPADAQVPERLELVVPAGGLDPAALVGEQVLIRAVPSDRPERASSTQADWFAEVVAAERRGDEIRAEAALFLDAGRRRFLTRWQDRRWLFTAVGGRLLDRRMLEQIRRTGEFIDGRLAEVGGGVLDPHAQLAVARYIVWGRKDEERHAGEDPLKNRYLLSVLGRVRGPERVGEVFDDAHEQALITVFLKNANFVDVGRLMDAVGEYASTALAPLGVRVGFAGDVAVSQAMIDAIVSTQTRSLLLSLVGIFLVAALWGRSAWLGVLCLLPPGLAVVVNFSMMGATGIPLGVATSMFSAMTIGIGVDFAIHLTERYRLLAASRPDPGERLGAALAITGPAILMNTIVIAVGFGLMTVSQVPANGRLGVFVVASVGTCFLATLVLLPLLLAVGVGRPVATRSRRHGNLSSPCRTTA